MRKILGRIFSSAAFLAAIALGGCSTARDSTSDAASRGGNPDIRKVQGSLEDLRRGAAPTTPKESALKEIYFDFDSYNLSAAARETLKASAEWLNSNGGARVDIEGHCDERGTTEYNLALGAKRAQAAKDYLVNLGVAAGRLSTTSFGKEAQVCRDHNEQCWQKNRRDRFVVRSAKPGV